MLEIKDKLSHTEIILSAIITAFIYGIQLFRGMKKYRKDINEYREKGLKSMIEDRGISKNHARSKAIQYPGYVIRYTLGGFVITFHLLIFVAFIPRLIWRHFYAFGWILEFLVPILISYALQSLIAKLSSRLVDTRNQTDPDSVEIAGWQPIQNTLAPPSQWKDNIKNNLKNILQYFILVASKTLEVKEIHKIVLSILDCFIGIISSIIRLILGLVLHIAYMNRIDFCLFQESLEKFGKSSILCVLRLFRFRMFFMHFKIVRT